LRPVCSPSQFSIPSIIDLPLVLGDEVDYVAFVDCHITALAI